MRAIEGRVWCVDNNVDTDQIIAGKYLTIIDPDILKTHMLESLLPDFPQMAKPGDILIAGDNFGCGSSREHAPAAFKAAGLGAVVANSFARIFFRNAINVGLPALEIPGVRTAFERGQVARIALTEGTIQNMTTGKSLPFPPLPSHILEILEAGGLVEKVRRELAAQSTP